VNLYWKGFTMRRLLISSFFLTSLLLISCQQDQETIPIKEPQVDIPENEHVAASPVEMDEALEIAYRIQNQLSDIFNFAYYYYGEEIEPVSLETFQDMQKRLSNYVTAHFLEQQLNTTIKEYCYFGCGVLFLPFGVNDETTALTETAADRFTLSTSNEPSIYMNGGIQHVTYVLENGVWKIDASVFEKTADQLDDVIVPVDYEDAYLSQINPVIDAFNERISTLQEQLSTDNEEEMVSVSVDEATIKQSDINQQYDAFLEELATEIRQIDKTFNDNQQVWEEMRAYAVQREMEESESFSHLKLYENMTLARINSLISRYHTY